MSALIMNQAPTDFKITSLDALLGAVVTGIDTSQPLPPSSILQIKKALCDDRVLIFKHQKLTEAQLLDFAMYFGALFVPPNNVPVLGSMSLLKNPSLFLTTRSK